MADPDPLPDDALVVRGGVVPFKVPLHHGCVVHPLVGCYGFSVQSAEGKALPELARHLPNRQVSVTTVGAIRALGPGYDVIRTPGRGDHATVVVPADWSEKDAEELTRLFGGASNPNPRKS